MYLVAVGSKLGPRRFENEAAMAVRGQSYCCHSEQRWTHHSFPNSRSYMLRHLFEVHCRYDHLAAHKKKIVCLA